MQLHEQFRPSDFSQVVGQERVINRIRTLQKRGLSGRSYFLSGRSGTGKSTIAYLIAAEVAGETTTDEIDAETLLPRDVQDWGRRIRCKPLGSPGWCLIINEAHGLRKDTIRQLLVTLERLPGYATVILTTTQAGQDQLFSGVDSHPLLSRCVKLELETQGLEAEFARHVRKIAQSEDMDGQPLEQYKALVRRERCNLRAVFQAIESGELSESAGSNKPVNRLVVGRR